MATIHGTVSNRNTARIRLLVRGPDGSATAVTAVVDTGFTGSLTLPEAVIRSLGLILTQTTVGLLADGTECEIGLYDAEVEWGGQWRAVVVSAVGTEVLLGMRLLLGHELRIAVVPGGAVEISPLP